MMRRAACRVLQRSTGFHGFQVSRGLRSFSTVPTQTSVHDVYLNALKDKPHVDVHRVPELDVRFTIRDMQRRIEYLAFGMNEWGAQKGSRIVVYTDNAMYYPLIQIAAAQIGLVACFVTVDYNEQKLRNILNVLQPYAFVFAGKREEPHLNNDKMEELLINLFPEALLPSATSGIVVRWRQFPFLKRLFFTPGSNLYDYQYKFPAAIDLEMYDFEDDPLIELETLCSNPANASEPALITTNENGDEAFEFTSGQVAANSKAVGDILGLDFADRVLVASCHLGDLTNVICSMLVPLQRYANASLPWLDENAAEIADIIALDQPNVIIGHSKVVNAALKIAHEDNPESIKNIRTIFTDNAMGGERTLFAAFPDGQGGAKLLPGIEAKHTPQPSSHNPLLT